MFGGTALGWYRECSIIPYTTDVDFASPIAEWSDKVEKAFIWNKRYVLLTVFGLVHVHKHYNEYTVILQPNDSLEVAVNVEGRKIDLFFLNADEKGNGSWVGGMIPWKREKLRCEL